MEEETKTSCAFIFKKRKNMATRKRRVENSEEEGKGKIITIPYSALLSLPLNSFNILTYLSDICFFV